IIPQALTTDAQFRASFPTMTGTGNVLGREPPLADLRSSEIATADNHWRGSNRGGWTSPDYERLSMAYETTQDQGASNQIFAQIMRTLSKEVPPIPLYYTLGALAHTADLRGPHESVSTDGAVWNVHEWEFRAAAPKNDKRQ